MKEKEHYQRERGGGSGINSLTTVTLDKYSRYLWKSNQREEEGDYTSNKTRYDRVVRAARHRSRWIYLKVFVFLIAPTRRDTRD